MSKFYGTVVGMSSTAATRRGSASSGIRTAAQSYDGSVIVNMDYRTNEDNSEDLFVRVGTNEHSSTYTDWSCPEFAGTFEEFKALLQLNRDIQSGKVSVVRHRTKKS